MNGMHDVGRFLITAGTVVVVVGFLLLLSDKLPLGRLPGDLRLGVGKFRVYVPIMTSILLSVLLTILLNVLWRK
jgi:ribose/xylose/arabinose/galactoside ABC-type transport system permease subunit